MKLNWQLHPKQVNVQVATSAAFQYRVQTWNDGQAALSVQHRGDRPSVKPVKYFVYKGTTPAFGGAQRFEDKHGYRDPAHHAPAQIVPFLPELHPLVRPVIDTAADEALSSETAARYDEGATTAAAELRTEYEALCLSVLCCRVHDCYARTEIDTPWCDAHRETNETTED